MLTREDVDAHALRRQGWTISAIARHPGHDRKTVQGYLDGGRVAGERAVGANEPRYTYRYLSAAPELLALAAARQDTAWSAARL